MCLGKTHCALGAVAGAGYAEYAHLPFREGACLTAFSAGLAVLPDIDHLRATLARSFGFVTYSTAWVVGHVSGGHRNGTHSFLGAGVLTGLAMLAVHFRHDVAGRIGLCFLLALTFSALFCATTAGRLAVKELRRIPLVRCVPVKHVTEAAAVGLGCLVAAEGWGLQLLGLATIIGCLAHMFADGLTKERVPLFWPFSKTRFGLLPECFSFTTDHWQEHWIVMPAAGAAFVALAFHAVVPHAGLHEIVRSMP